MARALHQQGMLAGLITDWYAFGSPSVMHQVPISSTSDLNPLTSGVLQSIARRLSSVIRHPSALVSRCNEIPDGLVRAFPYRSLLWKWRVRRLTAQGRRHEAFLQTDGAFANAVARLKLPPHEVFFGYSYASLEMLTAEKQRGVFTVLDQIDPGPVEFRLVAEEMARHPEIAGQPPEFPSNYYERNRREWNLADAIVVNSEWSRDALISEGVNPSKIEILPLAYGVNVKMLKAVGGRQKTENTSSWPPPQHGEGAIRVLFLGQVNVRKGIYYLLAAARLLEGERVHFDVVGPLGILPKAVASAPRNITFYGPASRDRAAEWYQQSDVFVLPTLSDGFALTQLEAMAHGLPVITTPNCGRVVEEGKTGFIIPPRDAQALAEAILKILRNPKLTGEMAPKCRAAAAAYSIDKFGARLSEIIRNRMPGVQS